MRPLDDRGLSPRLYMAGHQVVRSLPGTKGFCDVSIRLQSPEYIDRPRFARRAGDDTPSRAQEAWDAIYLGGNKVGYYHTKVAKVPDAGRDLLRVTYEAFLKFKRGNDTVSIQQQYGTIETPGGEVLKLETRVYLGQTELRTYGEVHGDKMVMTLNVGSQVQEAELAWGPDVRGPYGAELSMTRQPIKPGETRKIKTFIPVLNKVGLTTLEARDLENVELGGGVKRSLLRIEGKLADSDGKPIIEGNTTYWVDQGGQILKSYTDVFGGQTTYRTTQAAALAPIAGGFDLLKESILKVRNKIPNPEKTRNVVYRLTVKDDDPSELFPADRRQKVEKRGDHSVQIEVRTAGTSAGQPGPEKVSDEFLRANTQINSDDAKVVELMHKAVGDRTDPWAKAVAIEHWVATNMTNKNFETAFAPASEVARTLSGDCSEHSVLTAAMCRAAGIPTARGRRSAVCRTVGRVRLSYVERSVRKPPLGRHRCRLGPVRRRRRSHQDVGFKSGRRLALRVIPHRLADLSES